MFTGQSLIRSSAFIMSSDRCFPSLFWGYFLSFIFLFFGRNFRLQFKLSAASACVMSPVRPLPSRLLFCLDGSFVVIKAVLMKVRKTPIKNNKKIEDGQNGKTNFDKWRSEQNVSNGRR